MLGVNGTKVNYGGSVHNPIYVLSFSEPEAPAVATDRYGTSVAHIDDVASLVRRLSRAVADFSFESRELLSVVLHRVRYSRDTTIDPEPTRDERHNLMSSQKDQRDADDREWRVAVTVSGPVAGAPDEFWVSFETIADSVAPAV